MRIISQLHGEAKRRRAEVGGLLTVNGAPGGMTPRRAAPQAAQFDFLIKPSDIYDACDIIRRLKLSDHISVTFRYVRYTSKFKFRNGNIGFVTLEYLDARDIKRKLSSRRCS